MTSVLAVLFFWMAAASLREGEHPVVAMVLGLTGAALLYVDFIIFVRQT